MSHSPTASFISPDACRKIVITAVLVSVGAAMTWISWLKWADLMVDFGEQVYLSWQVSEGRVLYKDLVQVHGPFAVYLHALVFKLLGPGILTLALFNIFLTATLSYLIYILIRKSSDQLTATACALVFITLFALGQYKGGGNFNFICAYVYELPHGIALSFLSLYLFSRYIEKKTLPRLAQTYFCAGLVFLTKVEVFLAAISAITFAMALTFYLQSLDRASWFRNILVCTGSFLFGPFLFFIYFSMHVSPGQAMTFIASPWIHVFNSSTVALPIYKWTMGMDSIENNLIQLFKFSFLGFAVMIAVILGNRWISRASYSKPIIISLGGLAAGLLFALIRRFDLLELLRPLPLITLLIIIYYFLQVIQNRKSDLGKHLTQLALSIFSLTLLLKIIFNTHIYHYGFALALPATLVCLRAVLYELPRHKKLFPGSTDFYRSAMVVLGLFLIMSHTALGHTIHQLKTYPVGSGRDIILDYDPELEPRGPIVAETLKYIQDHVEPHAGIATMPAGNTINYLTRHPNPLRMHGLNPVEAHIFGEEQYLKELKSVSPEYILLVETDFTILGFRYFGKDYAQGIYQWVQEHYAVEKQFGAEPFTGKGFGIQILKRKDRIAH